jgi:hypothetical protein
VLNFVTVIDKQQLKHFVIDLKRYASMIVQNTQMRHITLLRVIFVTE